MKRFTLLFVLLLGFGCVNFKAWAFYIGDVYFSTEEFYLYVRDELADPELASKFLKEALSAGEKWAANYMRPKNKFEEFKRIIVSGDLSKAIEFLKEIPATKLKRAYWLLVNYALTQHRNDIVFAYLPRLNLEDKKRLLILARSMGNTEVVEKVVKFLEGSDEEVALAKASVLWRKGQRDKAIDIYKNAYRKFSSRKAFVNLISGLLELGRISEAESLVEADAFLNGKDAAYYYCAAIVKVKKGDFKGGLNLLNKSLNFSWFGRDKVLELKKKIEKLLLNYNVSKSEGSSNTSDFKASKIDSSKSVELDREINEILK